MCLSIGAPRRRVRVYGHSGTVEAMKKRMAEGLTAFKTGPAKKRPSRQVETPGAVKYAGRIL